MSKDFLDFLDDKGLLIQKSDKRVNMIDTMFLTANSLYQKKMAGHTLWFNGEGLDRVAGEAKKLLEHEFGTHRRYWKTSMVNEETKLYDNPNTLSRDNHIGFLIMLGEFGYKKDVRATCFNILKRGSFFQNKITNKGKKKALPDLCGLSTWSILLRAAFSKTSLLLMLPLLLALDAVFLLHVLFGTLKSIYDPTYTSTVYHELSAIIQAENNIPTPFTKIATKVFLRRKPVPGYEDESSIVSALKYYSRAKYDAPIYEIARESVNGLCV